MGEQLTVADLVVLLSDMDQSFPVYIAGGGGEWTKVMEITDITVDTPDYAGDEPRPLGCVIWGPAP